MNFGRTIGDRGLLTVSAANVLSLCSDDGTHSVAADQRKTTVTRTAAAAVAPLPLVRNSSDVYQSVHQDTKPSSIVIDRESHHFNPLQ